MKLTFTNIHRKFSLCKACKQEDVFTFWTVWYSTYLYYIQLLLNIELADLLIKCCNL